VPGEAFQIFLELNQLKQEAREGKLEVGKLKSEVTRLKQELFELETKGGKSFSGVSKGAKDFSREITRSMSEAGRAQMKSVEANRQLVQGMTAAGAAAKQAGIEQEQAARRVANEQRKTEIRSRLTGGGIHTGLHQVLLAEERLRKEASAREVAEVKRAEQAIAAIRSQAAAKRIAETTDYTKIIIRGMGEAGRAQRKSIEASNLMIRGMGEAAATARRAEAEKVQREEQAARRVVNEQRKTEIRSRLTGGGGVHTGLHQLSLAEERVRNEASARQVANVERTEQIISGIRQRAHAKQILGTIHTEEIITRVRGQAAARRAADARLEMDAIRSIQAALRQEMARPGGPDVARIGQLSGELRKMTVATEQAKNVMKEFGLGATGAGRAAGAFAGAAGTAANAANIMRFRSFQISSALQDAAIGFSLMGFNAAGLQLAIRGASNNLGVMAAAAGGTTAILGTMGIVAMDLAIGVWRGFSRASDKVKEHERDVTKLLDRYKQLKDVTDAVRDANKDLAEAMKDLERASRPKDKAEGFPRVSD